MIRKAFIKLLVSAMKTTLTRITTMHSWYKGPGQSSHDQCSAVISNFSLETQFVAARLVTSSSSCLLPFGITISTTGQTGRERINFSVIEGWI